MPLPLTVSCFSKIQIGFTFLVPAHVGIRGQRAVKRVCVCVCVQYAADIQSSANSVVCQLNAWLLMQSYVNRVIVAKSTHFMFIMCVVVLFLGYCKLLLVTEYLLYVVWIPQTAYCYF